MTDDPQSPPPGWSSDQPPPYRGDGSAEVGGWAVQPPGPPDPANAGTSWSPPPTAPKPGVVPLRPLGVGEILSGAIDYVRREPKTVITVAAMVGVVAAFVQLILVATTADSLAVLDVDDVNAIDPDQLVDVLVTLGTIGLVTSAVAGVLQIFGTGMLTHVMGRAVIGQRTSVSEAWVLVKPQLLRLIAATVLVGVAVGVAVTVPLVPGGLLLASGANGLGFALLLIGGVLATVAGVWVAFGLILTTAVVALEDCGPILAIKRSWRLVKGAFWRTLGIILLGTIVAQAVGSIAASPFSLMGGATGEITTWSVFSLAAAGMIATLVALPFVAGVTALVYIDRRIRTENLATVLQASAQSLG